MVCTVPLSIRRIQKTKDNRSLKETIQIFFFCESARAAQQPKILSKNSLYFMVFEIIKKIFQIRNNKYVTTTIKASSFMVKMCHSWYSLRLIIQFGSSLLQILLNTLLEHIECVQHCRSLIDQCGRHFFLQFLHFFQIFA